MRSITAYRGTAACKIGNGQTTLFWKDLWDGNLFCQKYPRLFSFVKKQDCSVQDFFNTEEVHDHFHLPLSEEVYIEYTNLLNGITSVHVSNATQDTWHYIWRSSIYASSRFYNFYFSGLDTPAPFKWIWKSRCIMKLKVFCLASSQSSIEHKEYA